MVKSNKYASQSTILVVDDNPHSLEVIGTYLEGRGFDVRVALDGEAGLARARQVQPDLILLDIMLPGINGFEVCQHLKEHQRTKDIPVIFMTALASVEDKVKGFKVGGVDYITKPIQHTELLARVTTHLRIQSLTKSLQEKNLHLQRMMDILFKRTMQLETSNQVGQQVTLILDLDKLLHKVVGVIQLNFEYYFIGIWMFNQTQQKIVLQARAGDLASLPSPDFELSMQQTDCAVVWVCKNGRSWLVENIDTPPRYLNVMDTQHKMSEFIVPLQVHNNILGAMEVLSGPNTFETEDQLVLQGIADQIAIAIYNVQLYHAEQLRRQEISRLNQQLEQKVAQRTNELRKAYRNLEQIGKTKNYFIEIASHELRTPLALVKGYAQMLKSISGNCDSENMHDCLSGMLIGVERLESIVNLMFDVAKIDNQVLDIRHDPTNIFEVITEVSRQFKQALQTRNLHLEFQNLENLPEIPSNPDLLAKVFYHLIINAIKYTPDGGKITISGKELKGSNAVPGLIEIIVSDTGIGIDEEYQSSIFEKFYQIGKLDLHSSGKTTFKGGGIGLGLAIVQGIVLAHQGQIWVESEGYNEETCPGSRFHILLPVSPQPHYPKKK